MAAPRLQELVQTEYELKQQHLAIVHCEKFAALVPESPIPWQISASIFHQAQRLQQAMDAYRQALSRDPDRQEKMRISYQIVLLTLHMGDISGARQQLDQLLKLAAGPPPPNDSDVASIGVLEAQVLYRESAVSAALEALDRVLSKWPESAGGRLLRGSIYLEQGKAEEALVDLTGAVEAFPFESQSTLPSWAGVSCSSATGKSAIPSAYQPALNAASDENLRTAGRILDPSGKSGIGAAIGGIE